MSAKVQKRASPEGAQALSFYARFNGEELNAKLEKKLIEMLDATTTEWEEIPQEEREPGRSPTKRPVQRPDWGIIDRAIVHILKCKELNVAYIVGKPTERVEFNDAAPEALEARLRRLTASPSGMLMLFGEMQGALAQHSEGKAMLALMVKSGAERLESDAEGAELLNRALEP